SEASIQKPARAKPALDAGHRTLAGAISDPLLALDVGVFHFRAPALQAQRILGEGVGRGEAPLRRIVGALAVAPASIRPDSCHGVSRVRSARDAARGVTGS